ncbi:MAG: tetraacyldisaccharide 4'-kinase, partial [Bacteroidales bacterium]|nr:tetraacyldisaccharide 4'-kinase [Bacteroidales bacterium]
LPFSWLYGALLRLRRRLFRCGIRKSYTATVPVISVGNLCLGGSGKTPHTEYLIRLLLPYYKIATLSRGYKRKTKGAWLASQLPQSNADTLGDEPFLYHYKYDNCLVAVSERRQAGIELLQKHYPNLQAILLDDAYQHLSVKRDINILLTEYAYPWFQDFVLPAGRLREPRSAAKDADIVIVTKCSPSLSEEEAHLFAQKLKLLPHQQLFFTAFQYKDMYPFSEKARSTTLTPETPLLALTGIAHPQSFLCHLAQHYSQIRSMAFPDHHRFTPADLQRITEAATTIPNTAIITTEKDAMRLLLPEAKKVVSLLSVFILPIEVKFLFEKETHFNRLIYGFIEKNWRECTFSRRTKSR